MSSFYCHIIVPQKIIRTDFTITVDGIKSSVVALLPNQVYSDSLKLFEILLHLKQ